MDEKRHDALEQALAELAAGKELTEIIQANSDLEAEIKTAQLFQSLSPATIPSAVIRRSRTRVLSRAKQLRQVEQTGWGALWLRTPRLVFALILAIVFLISWNGLLVASAQALPGDQLYPAKLTLEKLRLGMALNPQTHQKVEEEYQDRRIDEVKRLLVLGRVEFVKFFGILEHQWDDHWIIEGIEVRLLPETIVLGEIQPGMKVEVEGATQPDGWVQAAEIHLQNFTFVGTVEVISETAWLISGREVLINSQSQVSSRIQVGDMVMAEVNSDDFGTLTAVSITINQKEDSGQLMTETPVPTDEAQNEAEDTPEMVDDTNDYEPEEETETQEPDEREKTDEPDETEEPEETNESGETDRPDETDEPDEPDETDEPDEPEKADEP